MAYELTEIDQVECFRSVVYLDAVKQIARQKIYMNINLLLFIVQSSYKNTCLKYNM